MSVFKSFAVVTFAFFATVANAQEWPTKPVRLVVPFPPGGSVDPLARLLGAKLSDSLKHQFIVENKPGASGSIGTASVAKSPPDGYSFVVVFDTHAVNPTLIPNMQFDTAKDLAPVMLVGTAPMAIATHPGKPYKNFGDVIKAAKAKPDSVTFGSIGNGSLGHLTMILVQQAADVKKTLTETLGMDIVAASPEATQKFLLGEMARWGKVVKENGIKAD